LASRSSAKTIAGAGEVVIPRIINPESTKETIEPDFFERKAREWRQTQKRLADQIAEYENASHDYVHDGVRLLELAKKAYFLFKQQSPSEKRKLLNFVCSNSVWKDQTLTATFRQPFDFLHLPTRLGKEKGRWN
jgi:hypothetical protein